MWAMPRTQCSPSPTSGRSNQPIGPGNARRVQLSDRIPPGPDSRTKFPTLAPVTRPLKSAGRVRVGCGCHRVRGTGHRLLCESELRRTTARVALFSILVRMGGALVGRAALQDNSAEVG